MRRAEDDSGVGAGILMYYEENSVRFYIKQGKKTPTTLHQKHTLIIMQSYALLSCLCKQVMTSEISCIVSQSSSVAECLIRQCDAKWGWGWGAGLLQSKWIQDRDKTSTIHLHIRKRPRNGTKTILTFWSFKATLVAGLAINLEPIQKKKKEKVMWPLRFNWVEYTWWSRHVSSVAYETVCVKLAFGEIIFYSMTVSCKSHSNHVLWVGEGCSDGSPHFRCDNRLQSSFYIDKNV